MSDPDLLATDFWKSGPSDKPLTLADFDAMMVKAREQDANTRTFSLYMKDVDGTDL